MTCTGRMGRNAYDNRRNLVGDCDILFVLQIDSVDDGLDVIGDVVGGVDVVAVALEELVVGIDCEIRHARPTRCLGRRRLAHGWPSSHGLDCHHVVRTTSLGVGDDVVGVVDSVVVDTGAGDPSGASSETFGSAGCCGRLSSSTLCARISSRADERRYRGRRWC